MFHLYQSNKVERLLTQLVTLLLPEDQATAGKGSFNPLASELIVVENPGLSHWLKMQLANTLGIAANVEFPMPSRFFWQIQRKVLPELPSDSLFTKNSLRWLILQWLESEEYLTDKDYQVLRGFLQSGEQHRRYQLANTLADLYDQYLVYRPDWIERWEAQDYSTDMGPLEQDRWQGKLWFTLQQKVAQLGLCQAHRASMLQDFLTALQNLTASDIDQLQLPARVIFFGFTSLPKHQLQALQLLSQYMEVHVLTPNPCEQYWGDVLDETTQARLRLKGKDMSLSNSGNDLLASLGTLGKDYQRLLLDMEDVIEHDLFLHPAASNALEQLQGQVAQLTQPIDNGSKMVLPSTDDSIKLVGCHSPLREVEVLHDHLLKLFEQGLSPQEVVVMIPDVASYAPFIDAVFNSSDYPIPYSISDRPLEAEQPLLHGFLTLLNLPQARLGFSEVFALLEIPAVYGALGLQESQLDQLKFWLRQANVRWGFDEQHRSQLGLPAWSQNTWLHGFKRLLMGYALHEDARDPFAVSHVEGLETASLGPLMAFVQKLYDFIQFCQEKRSPAQWLQYLQQFVQEFFLLQGQDQDVLQHILLAMEQWSVSLQSVAYQGSLQYDIVADGLRQQLQQSSGSQHFMVGKVNFCTLLPMRSIPFQVVAVLGLNDQDYPRTVIHSSLDLMVRQKRLGDRSRRDEDRYLFLEALLSARHSLWLSYRSRSQHNNDELTPSVVLAEVMDYLERHFEDEKGQSPLKRLFVQHPLQAFNSAYFDGQSELYSYNKNWLQALTEEDKQSSNEEDFQREESWQGEVLLENLTAFYQNPSKYFLNQCLDINFYQQQGEIEDLEPFTLQGLDAYKIRMQLLTELSAGQFQLDDLPAMKNWAEDQLAFGSIGDQQWQSLMHSVQPLLENAHEYLEQAKAPAMEVNVPLQVVDKQLEAKPCRLMGWVNSIYGEHLLHVHAGKFNAKHLLAWYLELACVWAMGKDIKGVLITQDKKCLLMPPSKQLKATAMDYLQQLLFYYQHHQSEPLAFFPKTAYVAYQEKIKAQQVFDQMQKVFFGSDGPFALMGEYDDLHIQRCFEGLQPGESLPPINDQVAQVAFAAFKQQLTMEAL